MEGIKRRMQRFVHMNKLKKVALNVIAQSLTENEIGHLRGVRMLSLFGYASSLLFALVLNPSRNRKSLDGNECLVVERPPNTTAHMTIYRLRRR